MAAEIIIERAVAADVPGVKTLIDGTWRETYGPIIGLDLVEEIVSTRHSTERLTRHAEDKEALFLVARQEGQIVGHMFAVRFPDHAYVDRLHVHRDTRGTGLGARLMAEAEQWQDASVPVRVEVMAGNDHAHGFYLNRGYQQIYETQSCGGQADVPAYMLEFIHS